MMVKIVVPTSGSLLATLLPPSGFRRRQRRSDHARLAGRVRRAQLRRRAQQGRELSEALAHGAAEDEHVGPEQLVHRQQVVVDARGPGGKVQTLRRPYLRGGPLLGVHAAQFQVPEFAVGKEFAAGEQRRADAGAESQHDHRAGAAAAAAETHLGEAGGIRVIQEQYRPRQRPRGERRAVGAYPRGVDVGGGIGGALLDDAREGDPDPAGGRGESPGQSRQHAHQRGRGRRAGCGRGNQLAREAAGRDVDQTRLHRGAADVDSQHFTGHGSAHRLAAAASCRSRARRRWRARIHTVEIAMPVATSSTMIVASALTSGVTPKRTLEKMTIGNVLAPGPATNCVMTRSSQDSVKASSHPEAIAGRMSGSVMRKNAPAGRAPRPIAASSSASSNPARRDCTTTVTYAMQKVMWASVMVTAPTPFGQPISCSVATNNSSSDRPVMTSGMTIGAAVIPASSMRPRKAPRRASAIPASVPSTTAALAEISAMRIDSQAARRICSLLSSATYHLRVGECAASHTVTRRELLNENTIIDTIGRYRNTSPRISAVRVNRPRAFTWRPRAGAVRAAETA